MRELVESAFGTLQSTGESLATDAPTVVPQVITRTKELEQSHLCLGTNSYPQNHEDRYVSYIMNTVLGGSMSSRLFQNVSAAIKWSSSARRFWLLGTSKKPPQLREFVGGSC